MPKPDQVRGVEPTPTAMDRASLGDSAMMVGFLVAGALVTLFFLNGAFSGFIPKMGS